MLYGNAEEWKGLKHKKSGKDFHKFWRGEERLVEEKHAYRNKAVQNSPHAIMIGGTVMESWEKMKVERKTETWYEIWILSWG